MDNVVATAAIIGLINGAKLLELPDKKSFYYFLLALVAGVIAGFFGLFELTLESGILTALASSGLYKTAQVVRGESSTVKFRA